MVRGLRGCCTDRPAQSVGPNFQSRPCQGLPDRAASASTHLLEFSRLFWLLILVAGMERVVTNACAPRAVMPARDVGRSVEPYALR